MNTRDPLADLAAIVREINSAAQDHSRLDALLSAIYESERFQCVMLLASKGAGKPFVACDVRGIDQSEARGWQTWPLRRLFESMRPRRIAHPRRASSALAIPFDYGDERCVVLAVLSDWAYEEQAEPFFTTLETFAVPRVPHSLVVPHNVPVSPVEPRILCFGLCPSLQIGVESMLARRAWAFSGAHSFREVQLALDVARPDILFIDLDHQNDDKGALLHLHAVLATSIKVIAFGAGVHEQFVRQGLVDALLTHDAPEGEVFSTLKRFVRLVPAQRKALVQEMTSAFEVELRQSNTPSELSAVGARHASSIMSAGWACLHLVADNGATYAAEYPRQGAPLVSTLPKAFLSDEALFQLQVDDRFYTEVSDDRRVVGAMSRLHPVSAASIPLKLGNRRLGALLSVSREAPADSTAFEALERFAGSVTRRFDEFVLAAQMGPVVERSGVWEYVRHGALEFAAYRSRSSSIVWDYRAARPDFGLLCVGENTDVAELEALADLGRACERHLSECVARRGRKARTFLAVCNPIASTIAYAAAGFPIPLLFDAAGPAGTLRSHDEILSGTVAIVPPTGMLIWDSALRQWLNRESIGVKSVTEALEDLRPPGIAIVITNSTGA